MEEGKAKSLFVMAHSGHSSYSSLYEVKIQPGGQVIGGGGECSNRRKRRSSRRRRVLLLEPVAARLPEHSHLGTARFFSRSKLYLFPNKTTRSTSKPPYAYVFDTETKSLVPFNSSPQAHKPYATVVSAYGKLYHLATNPHCWPEIPTPAFERYDPATNCWESLPPCPARPRKILGYAVCYGFILFSLGDDSFMAFDVTRKQWHEVQLWLPASGDHRFSGRASGDHRFSGRAVVVGDTIYTFKISSNSVVAYNFWWDLDQEGDVTFYISPQPDLEGLHINKAFLVQTGRYKFTETRQGYLVHLGNLDFCLVQNRFKKHRADREQKLCITTFQVVVDDERGGKHIIKTLHSTFCEVDSLIRLGFSFTPDCDDFEPTEEEMRQAATLSHLADFDANEFGMSHTIPQELIFDILARLSTKDLIRLMCVSKAWNAAIQDPEWAKLHRQLSIKRNSLDPTFLILPSQLDEFFTMTLFDNGTKGRLVLIKQQSKQVEKRNKILGCSNGLLCIYESMENEDFGLWNPTIHKFKRIPLSAFNKWTQSKTFYGFGYDSVNDDYKFVKMGQFKDPSGVVTSSEVQVYSLKLHSWKRVQDLPSHLNKDYILASNGVCLASSLHWLMRLGDKGGGPMIVLSLDLASEEYHWFSAPACYNSEHLSINYLDLHVMAGFLCFCFDTDSLRETWILKEYGVTKSWTKLCYYKRNWGCNPLIFSKCGTKILFARVAELFWYDLENKRIENVSTDIRPVRSRPLQTVTSVENLNLLRRRPELPYNNCH